MLSWRMRVSNSMFKRGWLKNNNQIEEATMNLREGTRRLALLLGVVGAVLGGYVSYMELQTVLDQRARHNEFERLANSQVIQQERKTLQEKTNSQSNFVPDWAFGGTVVNNGEIKTIYWRDKWEVDSIDTVDGKTHSSTLAPSAWLYLVVALLPVFGFFIPWGAIRAIGWVGAGFFQPSK